MLHENGNHKENNFKNDLQPNSDPVLPQHNKPIQFTLNQDNTKGKFERHTKGA